MEGISSRLLGWDLLPGGVLLCGRVTTGAAMLLPPPPALEGVDVEEGTVPATRALGRSREDIEVVVKVVAANL